MKYTRALFFSAALIVGTWLVLPASAQNYLCGALNGQPFCNVLLFGDGTAAAPSLTFASDPDTGWFHPADANTTYWAGGGSLRLSMSDTASWVLIDNTYALGFASSAAHTSIGAAFYMDAANTIAQRNGTANQTRNNYARRVSATEFNRTASKDISTTLSNVSGATVTATSLIPDGCVLVSVTTSVTTGLGGTTTGYSVGDGVDADRWGTVSAVAAGTDTDNTDWTVTTIQLFTAAQDVVLTALTANFNGTGVIQVHAGCLVGEAE